MNGEQDEEGKSAWKLALLQYGDKVLTFCNFLKSRMSRFRAGVDIVRYER